jgi:hypothetical protein
MRNQKILGARHRNNSSLLPPLLPVKIKYFRLIVHPSIVSLLPLQNVFSFSLPKIFNLINPNSTNSSSHVQLGVFAHVIGIALGPTRIGSNLILHAINERGSLFDAFGLFHAGEQRQCGFGAGFGL